MKIGVILSGCGVQDGSEIHEATLTLLFLDRADAAPVCYAPDKPQHDVVNHATLSPVAGQPRNILAEAARIARGAIRPLASADPDDLAGAILPGGYGVAKNLTTFASAGAPCEVDRDVARLLRALHAQGKPIGAICIAPVILAALFGGEHPVLTIGNDPASVRALETMGAVHRTATVHEVVVDRRLRLVTTPAYMLASGIAEAASGIERLVADVLRMAKTPTAAAKAAQ